MDKRIFISIAILLIIASSAIYVSVKPADTGDIGPMQSDNEEEYTSDKVYKNASPKNNTDASSLARHGRKIDLVQMYGKYIGDAKEGDSAAQFVISHILLSCGGIYPEDMDRLQFEFDKFQVTRDVKASINQKYKECVNLLRWAGLADSEEVGRAWLETAVESGNPVAGLTSLLGYPEVLDQEEVYPVLRDTLEYQPNNVIEQQQKFDLLAKYYSIYVEPAEIESLTFDGADYVRPLDRDAYDYLRCKHSVKCNPDKFLQLMGKHYHSHEIDAILARVEEIEFAIINKDWDTLELN